ncbi:MAG: hypothetical protein ACSW8C_05000 [bacterium]
MIKVPPFRTFVQPSGLPTDMPMAFNSKGNASNIFVDIPTLTYWYWMMYAITVDLGYTVNGGIEVAIRHQIRLEAQKVLPKNRVAGHWTMDSTLIHDDDLDITSVGWFLINEPRCDTVPPEAYTNHRKLLDSGNPNPPILWHTPSLPTDMRFGLCFKIEEYADNRDFTICTLPGDIHDRTYSNSGETQDRTIVASYKANFLGHEVPFYMSTPYPDDFSARFDFIRITPEFFEIDPTLPP